MAKQPVASILIVEDDGELLEILGFVLEDAGYKVIGVSDGANAIALIDTQPMDLVMLDLTLKEMSGLAVARHVRAQAKWDVLIALHTGQDEAGIREHFTDYDVFIPKSDNADVLLKKVADVLADKSRPSVAGASTTGDPTSASHA